MPAVSISLNSSGRRIYLVLYPVWQAFAPRVFSIKVCLCEYKRRLTDIQEDPGSGDGLGDN